MNRFLSLPISRILPMVIFLCVLSSAAYAAALSSAPATGGSVPEHVLPLTAQQPVWDVNFRRSFSITGQETAVMSAANPSPGLGSKVEMGNLRLGREYSLLPELTGSGISYAVNHKKHRLQAHVLKDDTRKSSRQITGASLDLALPLSSTISVSAESGAESTPYRSLSSQMILVKGTFARPAFQLTGELGMSLLDFTGTDEAGHSSGKAYRISGKGEWKGITYDGSYEYTGPKYRFLSRTVQQPDTIKKTLRVRRDTPVGGLRLCLTESETNVDRNPSYTGSFQRLAEVEYAPNLLKSVPMTLMARKGEAGVEMAGGGFDPTTKIDAAGGTVQVALDPVDVKVRTVHTWVSDHDTDSPVSKEMVLEVSPQLHLQQIRLEPKFSLQRRQDVTYNAVNSVYDVDFLMKKHIEGTKTHLDLTPGYSARVDDRSGRSDTYRSKIGVNWVPKDIPLGFSQAHVSLSGEFTREKYFWDQTRNGYSFMMTLELS